MKIMNKNFIMIEWHGIKNCDKNNINVISHQVNVNPNHNELSLHTQQSS